MSSFGALTTISRSPRIEATQAGGEGQGGHMSQKDDTTEGDRASSPLLDNAPRHSRRALVAGAAAAGAGIAASLVIGAQPAAAEGENVTVGDSFTDATSTTGITSSGSGAALQGTTTTDGGSGVAGVDSSRYGGTGVMGTSFLGTGLTGTSTAGTGVSGTGGTAGTNDGGPGVSGTGGNAVNNGTGGTGVIGTGGSGSGSGIDGFGVSGGSVTGTGVAGTSSLGTGVVGVGGEFGVGVMGTGNTNNGVMGTFGGPYPPGAYGGNGVLGVLTGSSPVPTGETTGGVLGVDLEGGEYTAGVAGFSGDGTGVIGSSDYVGVQGTATGPHAVGVLGQDRSTTGGAGVTGTSAFGVGVDGYSGSGLGVVGSSASNSGVQGSAGSGAAPGTPLQSGVVGLDQTGTEVGAGVSGLSGAGTGVVGSSASGDGVVGTSGGGFGVLGDSTGDDGVHGTTTADTKSGVAGIDSSAGGGYGLYGRSASGTGVLAASPSGTALKVEGKVTFSRSGLATIAKGKTSVTIPLAGVTTSTLVLATLQQVLNGVLIAGAVPATDSFTIYLSGAPTANLKVAWFVIG
jgi:hypothetical protein